MVFNGLKNRCNRQKLDNVQNWWVPIIENDISKVLCYFMIQTTETHHHFQQRTDISISERIILKISGSPWTLQFSL